MTKDTGINNVMGPVKRLVTIHGTDQFENPITIPMEMTTEGAITILSSSDDDFGWEIRFDSGGGII